MVQGIAMIDAFEQAGYSRNQRNASRLKDRPEVRSRIDHLMTIASQQATMATAEGIRAANLSRDWVIERLMENVAKASQAQPVMVGGEPTGEYRYDGAVVNKALEILGKVVGIEGSRANDGDGDVEAAKSTADPRVADALAGVTKARLHLIADNGKKRA